VMSEKQHGCERILDALLRQRRSRVLSANCPTRPRRQNHVNGRGACAAGGAAPFAATRFVRAPKQKRRFGYDSS
jgi:hypothetical protein